jgi:hypothetical protein
MTVKAARRHRCHATARNYGQLRFDLLSCTFGNSSARQACSFVTLLRHALLSDCNLALDHWMPYTVMWHLLSMSVGVQRAEASHTE